MKDKMIKIIEDNIHDAFFKNNTMKGVVEYLVDSLLSNGVIAINTDVISDANRPLISEIAGYPIDEIINLIKEKNCKVGDIVYQIDNDGNIYESKISKIIYETNGIAFDKSAIGKSVFLEKNKIKKNYC